MRVNLALGFVLLAGLFAAPACAFWSDEYLELLEVNGAADEYGLMVFSGTIQNTHSAQSINTISIFIVLKKEGRIVAIYRGFPEKPLSAIEPGETRSFEIETDYEQGFYDEFNVRLEGLLEPLDDSALTGEFYLIEESLNLTTNPEGKTVFYGELFNGTNAIVADITIQFTLLDARGDVIGFANPVLLSLTLKHTELWPDSKIDFTAETHISLNRIKDWEVSIGFEPIRIVEADVMTVLTDMTWGQIKSHSHIGNAE